jgi:two-component system, NarL family, response regulator DevR
MCAMPLGVFLLDDHEVVRTGLRALLEAGQDIDVVGEGSTVTDALARIPALKPDVAILDVRSPDGSGVEVRRDIRSTSPEIACVMLTSCADDEALIASVMAGAAGYVLKQVGSLDLIETIRRVGAGESLLDPSLSERVLARLRDGPKVDPRLASLTPQERRILDLIAGAPRTARSRTRCTWPRRRGRTTSPTCSPSWAWSAARRRPRSPPVSASDRPRSCGATPPGPDAVEGVRCLRRAGDPNAVGSRPGDPLRKERRNWKMATEGGGRHSPSTVVWEEEGVLIILLVHPGWG